MNRRILTAAIPLAFLMLTPSAGSALAECFPPPEDFPRLPYAFVATVTDISDQVAEPVADASDFEWHMELDVVRSYRGVLPTRIEANGWEDGCGFTGIRVAEGDRLFIATDRLDLGDPRLILGELLVWREVREGHWEFYAEALHDGSLGYPQAAVRANTTGEILAFIRGLGPPDTSTAPADPAGETCP